MTSHTKVKLRQTSHHVILTKYGEDVYVDETTIKSGYLEEKGRIENVAIISGNCSGEKVTLTQDNIVELRDILEILIEKERNRIGADENWGKMKECISEEQK